MDTVYTGLQRSMDRPTATAEEYGMKINTKKTKVIKGKTKS